MTRMDKNRNGYISETAQVFWKWFGHEGWFAGRDNSYIGQRMLNGCSEGVCAEARCNREGCYRYDEMEIDAVVTPKVKGGL